MNLNVLAEPSFDFLYALCSLVLEVGKELAREGRYPEAILKDYLSGLGNLKIKAPRKEYARKAQVMKKVHHVLVNVLHDAPRWRDFAISWWPTD